MGKRNGEILMMQAILDFTNGPYVGIPVPARMWEPTHDVYGRWFARYRRSNKHLPDWAWWHVLQFRRLPPWEMYRISVTERLLQAGYEIVIQGFSDMAELEGTWNFHNPPGPESGRGIESLTFSIEALFNNETVGSVPTAWMLHHNGIRPVRPSWASRCVIGFNDQEQRWYGWSHRAMASFGIGDVVEEGDCAASSGWLEGAEDPDSGVLLDISLPVGFKAESLDDARKIAEAFAESVS